jgi:hypothetical protein
MGMQIITAIFYYLFDITNRELAIPSSIDMYYKRTQAIVFDFKSQIGAINTTTQANNTIILFTGTVFFYLRNDILKPLSARTVGK